MKTYIFLSAAFTEWFISLCQNSKQSKEEFEKKMQNEALIVLVDQRNGIQVLGVRISGLIEVYVLYKLEITFQKQSLTSVVSIFCVSDQRC